MTKKRECADICRFTQYEKKPPREASLNDSMGVTGLVHAVSDLDPAYIVKMACIVHKVFAPTRLYPAVEIARFLEDFEIVRRDGAILPRADAESRLTAFVDRVFNAAVAGNVVDKPSTHGEQQEP